MRRAVETRREAVARAVARLRYETFKDGPCAQPDVLPFDLHMADALLAVAGPGTVSAPEPTEADEGHELRSTSRSSSLMERGHDTRT